MTSRLPMSGHASRVLDDAPATVPPFQTDSVAAASAFNISGASGVDASGYYVSAEGNRTHIATAEWEIYGSFRPPSHLASIAISAPFANSDAGISYIIDGAALSASVKTGASIDLSANPGVSTFSGTTPGGLGGFCTAPMGAFHSDGVDTAICAPGISDVWVVYAEVHGLLSPPDLNGSNGVTFQGEANSQTGASIASGDINGDGLADGIFGAPLKSGLAPLSPAPGGAYVVFGNSGSFGATFDLSTLNGVNGLLLTGAGAGDRMGWSSAVTDINGDGYSDMVVGAPYAASNLGQAYVVFGKASGFGPTFDVSTLDGTNGFRIDGSAASGKAGWSVSSAGDVNQDGYQDLIVGSTSGDSYLVFGKPSGFPAVLDLSSLDGSNGFKVHGSGFAGWQVAGAGDVNGDGFDDLLIGAWSYSHNGGAAGAAFIVYGKAAGFAATLDLSTLGPADGYRLDGESAFDELGFSVSSIGDLNGDGVSDFAVGAPNADPNGVSNAGRTYVILGALPTQAVTRVGTDVGQLIQGGDFNDRLQGMGGADGLLGHGGKDHLQGGTGDDVLDGGPGADVLDGGDGNDGATYASAPRAVTVDLTITGKQSTGGGGSDTLISIENLFGSAYGDHLTGDGGDNRIVGGLGADVMTGGFGADTFVFQSLKDSKASAPDLITDLTSQDVIDLSAIDANPHKPGDQAFRVVSAFDHHRGEIVLTLDETTHDTIISLNTHGDGLAESTIKVAGDQTSFSHFIF